MTDEEYYPEVSRRRGWDRAKFMAKNRPIDLVFGFAFALAFPFVFTYALWTLAQLLKQLPK